MGKGESISTHQDLWMQKDRISDLPNVLLTDILSFLPTKDVVRTSVLSKRWELLWACVPVLKLNDYEFFPKGANSLKFFPKGANRFSLSDYNGSKASFLTFVHSFLMQHKGLVRIFRLNCVELYDFSQILSSICAVKNPHLEKLHLQVFCFMVQDYIDSSPFRYWPLSLSYEALDTLVQQNARLHTGKIMIEWSDSHPSVLDSLSSLLKEWNIVELEFTCDPESMSDACPQTLFTWEMLVVLRLSMWFLDCPKDKICFPNLKVLHLGMSSFKNHDSASNLFSFSCPVLEELYINQVEWRHSEPLVISSHTLKRLNCLRRNYLSPCRIFIDTPTLVYLDLNDQSDCQYVVKNVNSLVEAKVSVKTDASELLKKIQNVKKLSLYEDTWAPVDSVDLPIYHWLTHLELSSCHNSQLKMMWGFVLQFLHKSPMLEHLAFKNVKFDLMSEQDVPDCLSSSLKTCEFDGLYATGNEVEVIGYFLKNSKVLERMTIMCCEPENVKKQAISAFPRASSACEIYYK